MCLKSSVARPSTLEQSLRQWPKVVSDCAERTGAFIFRFDGELLRMVVAYNSSPDFVEWVANHPIRPGRHSGSARAALERRTIHVPDVLADPEYTYGAIRR